MATFIKYLKEDIIEAAKFLQEHPDWEPDTAWLHELSRLDHTRAAGQIVEELSGHWD